MKLRQTLQERGLYFAWIIALIATCGSLFFSEVLHWEPCTLCWFQRIFMYPLVILLGIAGLRNDKKMSPYILTMSAMGFCFSVYHYLVQHIPVLEPYTPCTGTGVSCSGIYLNILGFITIPFLAGVAFLLIGTLMAFVALSSKNQEISLNQNDVRPSVLSN